METILTLVRHGETEWNTTGRIQGHLDIPLSATGCAGRGNWSAAGRRSLRFHPVERSRTGAADCTSDRASSRTGHYSRRRLRERHLGVLQGLTGEEAAIRHPHAWGAFKAAIRRRREGGETLAVFSQRVVGLIDELLWAHAGGRLLLVTHGGVLDAAYRHATGMPLDEPRNFPIYNASLNVLRHRGGVWTVESWGDVSHLPKELAMDNT
jgi:probable phosphoglycerate mutase